MFYDKHSMIDLYEQSMVKKQNTGKGWKAILLTSSVDVATFISEAELERLQRQWRARIKSCLHERDAAHMLNDGNIFLLVHEDHLDIFLRSVQGEKVTSRSGGNVLSSTLLFLESEEAEFLLTVPN